MTYCSLEEAWGENFFNPSTSINNNQITQVQTNNDNIPSYSGLPKSSKSNIVPYDVKFPEQSSRNFTHPIQDQEESDNDSALELLEDDDRDIRHIDQQRNVKPEYEPDYLTSEDYFLYKKYQKLANKYKNKLKRRYRNFKDENPNILEGFSSQTDNSNDYNIKDILIILIIGIFLIFILDIFVKIGARIKNF